MATRDEVIRFLIQTAGDKELAALAREMQDVAKAGDAAGEDIDGFVAELDKLATIDRNISKLTALKIEIAETERSFTAAKGKVTALEKEFDAAEVPTVKLKGHGRCAGRGSTAGSRAERSVQHRVRRLRCRTRVRAMSGLRITGQSEEIGNLTARWRDYVTQQNAAVPSDKSNASAGRA